MQFVLLVILMVTVIINVLFIIDAHGRLQNTRRDVTKNSARIVKMEIISSRERVQAVIDGTVVSIQLLKHCHFLFSVRFLICFFFPFLSSR